MDKYLNRREFMRSAVAGGATASFAASRASRAASPNERVVVGVVGMSRGLSLARTFAATEGFVVKYVCDVDSVRAAKGAEAVGTMSEKKPESVVDFRRILDDVEVDAMVFALPVHWHAPAAILACKAGKHVYVEKPCCHNPAEGEMLVAAARKYKRCVQMGNQRRSSEVIRAAIEKLHAGAIGHCYFVRSWYAALRGPIGRGNEAPVPENLDYDLWQGPAPRRPYRDNVIPYNWHWLWHWGTGELGNNGTHGLDLCRWGLKVDYPVKVCSAGGRYRYDDDQETPDTHTVTYDFSDGKTITWEGLSCNQPGAGGNNFGATFYGERGSLVLGSASYAFRDEQGKIVEESDGDVGDSEHARNFLDAIRNGDFLLLRSEIEEGYKSALLSHLGNIAYRTGTLLQCGEKGRIISNPAAQALWEREY
ncbi:MAG TPA: Gfo/Idh/MocA family oxidoreductase, partial [Candidatus Hydrogenedentes bacterium]|nr:Gfo/Idh/MocA family oxidoreductase [Candidatus Hydrogenedentota bacterium]